MGRHLKPLKQWLVFDSKGRHRGMLCKTKKAALAQNLWIKNYPTWEDAKRGGWTVKRVDVTEGGWE